MQIDLAGAHRHHLLVHLVNLIVHLEQLGFRRVSGAFVTTYTEQLASGFEKEDWMGTEGVK